MAERGGLIIFLFHHCKLQLGCLAILLYIGITFLLECRRYKVKAGSAYFDLLWGVAVFSVAMDGITACTVNCLDSVPLQVNDLLHFLFLSSLDTEMFVLFLYVLWLTGFWGYHRRAEFALVLVYTANILTVLQGMPRIEYRLGVVTNYASGFPADVCYVMAAAYILLTFAALFRHWQSVESHKRSGILTYLVTLSGVTLVQMSFPEVLLSSLAVTLMLLGVYLNLEAPSFRVLSRYHNETVLAFATLVESRDNSTGEHVRRTSRYVALICHELLREKLFENVLTRDYVENLIQAAPMHDIGKIAIPDAILKKPDRLTPGEFEIMKTHTVEGGRIILETFRELGTTEYRQIAYEVARYHHEKWNGKGYPDGLWQEQTPLCARIMAVADVFDAVSQKRCYKDNYPMETCFAIIEKGKGTDFDPRVADAFLRCKDEVTAVYRECTSPEEKQELPAHDI